MTYKTKYLNNRIQYKENKTKRGKNNNKGMEWANMDCWIQQEEFYIKVD